MFYLLLICSYLILCSEIHFSESLCFIGTSQFIYSVQYLTRFCLTWVFTKLHLQTHLRAISVLCVSFYQPAWAIISKPYVFLLLMFWVIKKVLIYLLSMPVSLDQCRGEITAFYNNTLAFSKIYIFCLLLSFLYGSILCRLDLIKLQLPIISSVLNGIMFFHFKIWRNYNLK